MYCIILPIISTRIPTILPTINPTRFDPPSFPALSSKFVLEKKIDILQKRFRLYVIMGF